ncbi:MAG TPA: hypothetical protein VED16_00585 [Candidatus Acidoferrum sp.]|nr:hypothetical protein [Candidatus Acidoferrum sp.]
MNLINLFSTVKTMFRHAAFILIIATRKQARASLETKLAGALSEIDSNYREMKGLERDVDTIYRRVS